MNNALNLIYYIFNKFITMLFDTFQIFPNVTIGWVMVSIIIISIMISNILSIAKNSISFSLNNKTHDMDSLHAKAKSRASNYYNFYERK